MRYRSDRPLASNCIDRARMATIWSDTIWSDTTVCERTMTDRLLPWIDRAVPVCCSTSPCGHSTISLWAIPLRRRIPVTMRPADRKRLFDGRQCRRIKIELGAFAMLAKMFRRPCAGDWNHMLTLVQQPCDGKGGGGGAHIRGKVSKPLTGGDIG